MLLLEDRLMLPSGDLPEHTEAFPDTTSHNTTSPFCGHAAATALSLHLATGVRGCLLVLEQVFLQVLLLQVAVLTVGVSRQSGR